MDSQVFMASHSSNAEGTPTGGCTSATGLCISWQHGPLGRGEDRKEPHGCFVETVIAAAIDRLEHYQRSAFVCDENSQAIVQLANALDHLRNRTAERESRGVEGTRTV